MRNPDCNKGHLRSSVLKCNTLPDVSQNGTVAGNLSNDIICEDHYDVHNPHRRKEQFFMNVKDSMQNFAINAAAFDQAAALEAAAAAMADAGYTGNYALRLTFVPANGDVTLDYAITFDSITAA